VQALEARFAGLTERDVESVAAAAFDLFGDHDWVGDLIDPLLAALRAEPFFEPPFRVNRDALRIGAVVFDHALVSITATVVSADALAALPPARTVVVPGRLTITRYVRAGGAKLRLWSVEPANEGFTAAAAPPCEALGTIALVDAMVLRLDGRVRGHLIEGAQADVVTLSATIRHGASPFMREYDIATRALVRVATLDDRASRTQMLLAYLRLAKRSDAAEIFAAAVREETFFLRWAAMREWLALDAGAALPALRVMAAEDAHPEVRATALATLPLVEALVGEQCRD
jgi:hypothetical protein